MIKILIDTNIYLRFFDTVSDEFHKLLPALVQLGDKVIVTDQIIDEINRNKLTVFRKQFQAVQKNIKDITSLANKIPIHLNSADQTAQDWNENQSVIKTKVQVQKSKISSILKTNSLKIQESTDIVSTSLNTLFANIITADEQIITKAEKRKNRGNPPGKRTDPLGDQINWEILLTQIEELDEIWIITNDRDFITFVDNDTILLNALLFKELKDIKPSIEIKTFDQLGKALKEYKIRFPEAENVPEEAVLNEIQKEESVYIDYCNCDETGPDFQGECTMYCENCCSHTNFSGPIITTNNDGLKERSFCCCSCGCNTCII